MMSRHTSWGSRTALNSPLLRYGLRNQHRSSALTRVVCAFLLLVGLIAVGPIRTAFALSITVNTTADESGSGAACSLREAIQAANTDTAFGGCVAGSGADTIVLASGATYDLGASPAISSTSFGPSIFPAISSSIVISGNGATLTRSGTTSARFFYVGSAGNLTLYELTVSNGRVVGGNGGNGAGGGGGAAGLGGAIFSEGSVTLDRSTFAGNAAIGGNGGNGSTSTTGTGGGGGGGMGANGASVANGTCAAPTTGGNGGSPNGGAGGASPAAGGTGGGGGGGNSDSCSGGSAVNGANGGFGGGGGGGGSDNSSGNSGNGGAGGFGGGGAGAGAEADSGNSGSSGSGGTYGGAGTTSGGGGGGGAGLGGVVFNHAGTLTVRNSTFSANSTTAGNAGSGGSPTAGEAHGGAIFNRNGTVTLNNVTVTANVNGGNGAVYNLSEGSAANLTVRNSILANTSGGDDCFSTGTSDTVTQSNSIMESDTSCGTPVSSADPGLAALATNGGSTQTHAITSSSPAYDAGSNATCETTDQRNVARPQFTTCDIGAFELAQSVTGLSAANSSPTRLTDATAFTGTITAGTGVTYVWNFGDGSSTASGANTSHTYASTGTYTAIVTATNINGSVSATTPVTITNSAPVANAGADQTGNVNATVNLNGAGSADPDGHTPLSYGWTQTGGPAVALSDATAASPSFTAPGTPNVLTFTLAVTDSTGLADPTPDEVVITIQDVAITGLIAQSSSPTRLTDSIAFTASMATGSNVVYTWDFGDGSPTTTGVNATHTYASAGSYTASVTATNGNGSQSVTTPVVVTNDAPIADAGADQSASIGAIVNLNGTGSSDPDNHLPLSHGWQQTGGPTVTLSSATSASPTFTAPAVPSVLTFTLTVTDAQGLADATPDEVVVTVGDDAITGLSAASSSPTRLTDATLFTATVTGGSNVAYTWNFGDGSPTSSGTTASHTYATTGSYTAIVTATNATGSTSANTVVNVTNLAPVADAGPDQAVDVGVTITLDGSGSVDPDGHTPLAYLWQQTGGSAVTLSNPAAAAPTFSAPAAPTVLTFTLAVTDGTGLAAATPDEVVIVVNDVAISGLTTENSSPTRLTDPTYFTATITAGSNTVYTWDFGDGTPLAAGATPTHTYAVAGTYTASVMATNGAGSTSATTPVTITNLAPVANAGADQTVSVGGLVTLVGIGSNDPDGHTPLVYLWQQTGGPSVTLSDPATVTPAFTAPAAPSALTFTLAVTDSTGLAGVTADEVVITLIDIGITGLAAQNSSPTRLTDPTYFTATITAGSGVAYTWSFGDGTPTVSGATATHTYAAAGSYSAIVTATNGSGSVTASTIAVVTNQAPIADAGPDQATTVGSLVLLNGGGSTDPDGHLPLAYLWQQTGGPAVSVIGASTASASFTAPAAPAVLTFTLSVTDAQGLADATPDEIAVTVGVVAITGLAAQSSSPTRLTDATYLTATITGGTNVSYQWNFGDGSPVANGANVAHTYATAGSYTAIVTATNSAGSQSASTVVAVTNAPPIADAGANQAVSVGGLVTLNGGASSDPDGHLPLTYVWQQTGGPAVTLSNPAAAAPTFTAPAAPATLTFALTATDAQGLADPTPDSVVIAVSDIGISGLAAQSSSPTQLGDVTFFTATITGGTGVTYSWNFGDGSPAVSGANATRTYATAGTYTAIVTATNSNGSVTAQTVVTVVAPPTRQYFLYLPLMVHDATRDPELVKHWSSRQTWLINRYGGLRLARRVMFCGVSHGAQACAMAG